MYVEERKVSNGLAFCVKVDDGEGVITYKRRKTNLLQEDSSRLADQKTTSEPHDMVFCHNTDEDDGIVRIDHPILLDDANDFQRGHWINVMEHIVQSPGLSEGGVKSCIRDALSSKRVAPKQTAQAKELVRSRGNMHKLMRPLKRQSESSWNAAKKRKEVSMDGFQKMPEAQTDSEKCRNVFLDVIASEKFVSLCSLVHANFHGIKAERLFDFGLIDSRMKNGEYEQSSDLFNSDILQVWEKFKKIGDEMFHLADSFSNISETSYHKQAGDLLHGASGEQNYEEINQVGTEQKDSVDLDATKRCLTYESNGYTKPDQNEACGLYKISTCGCCGEMADGKHSLICDGCEAMYHISCIKPAFEGIPTKSWYCAKCSANRKESPEHDGTHQTCETCKRCKDLGNENYGANNDMEKRAIRIRNDFEGTSDSRTGACRVQRSMSVNLRLCKLCRKEDDKEFCVCAHTHCLYKYYHKSCLRVTERPTENSHWYCPSCLCRACLSDKDDEKIVLCDGCDEAYHIYCMLQPLSSIPKGKWYCIFCNIDNRLKIRRMHEKGEF
ncbi:PHD finger protein EHD3-like [Tasmannia lanceolata]|uniref:PHD finger protein EHD3-like n=1 Tax=Tasmannia lanceolata TaxID=3420 RepID=UPI0040647D3A